MIVPDKKNGFTLVELMVAVVVTTVGMVVVLSALHQCAVVLAASEKQIAANYLLDRKIWESQELSRKKELVEGENEGTFEPPSEDFTWKRTVAAFPEGFGNESERLKNYLWMETLEVAWKRQGTARNLTVVRYVPKS
jgi:prepilin-type N-terminal cleavage/methylation domain-containing protein